MKVLVALVLTTGFVLDFTFGWTYNLEGNDGPQDWKAKYEKCSGTQQSPIDIKMSNLILDENLGSFNRSIFSKPFQELSAENNGHALLVSVKRGTYQIDHKGVLPGGKYELAQFHFHWGSNAMFAGSEHTVDGKQYFGELHLVHFNTKYGTLGEAVDKSDGLAVLGVFIEASYPQDNLAFTRMMNLLDVVKEPGYIKKLNESAMFSIETLLPCDISTYCRYQGSLTTPTCDESVTWTVFTDTLKISQRQADTFAKTLQIKHSNVTSVLKDNFRPVQPLNGRIVYQPPTWVRESSSVALISSTLLQLAMLVIIVFY